MSNYTQSDYERDLAIRGNRPKGANYFSIHTGEYIKSGATGWFSFTDGKKVCVTNADDLIGIVNLVQLETAIAQYETIKKLKAERLQMLIEYGKHPSMQKMLRTEPCAKSWLDEYLTIKELTE